MEQILIIINITLTAITMTVGYLTYRFSKKKDLEDKLFNMKIDTYKELNELCYEAYKKMNPNAEPFVKIYDFENKKEWEIFCERQVFIMDKVGLNIQDKLFKYTLFLPTDVTDKIFDYCQYLVSYITQYSHFDKELNLTSHDRIWIDYVEILKSMREDLKIENIDNSLLLRIDRKIF